MAINKTQIKRNPVVKSIRTIFPLLLLIHPILSYAEEVKKAGELEDVVIKAEQTQKPSIEKPPLQISFDPYETIRESLKPNESLLLAEHPETFVWKRTHPEILHNGRVIRPLEASISEELSIHFDLPHQFMAAGKPDSGQAKHYQWAVTIANEEGKVFQHFEGKGYPLEELVWDGKNEKGESLKPGHPYSAVLLLTDPKGEPHTVVNSPLQFKGIVRKKDNDLFLSLDSNTLFGADKRAKHLLPQGENLLRESADWIKRRHFGFSIRVLAYGQDSESADSQAKLVKDFLVSELMVTPQTISIENYPAPSSEQRIDLVLLNR